MLKIAVCDDEKYMLDELSGQICLYMKNKSCEYSILYFESADKLLKDENIFDIIFFDIQMKGLNGMEAAKKLRKEGIKSFFIFVTVLNDYVYDAFEVSAVDYILKPLEYKHFSKTMDRIFNNIEYEKNFNLTIQKGNFCRSIKFSDIYYCEAINRKIYVHTKNVVIDYYCKMEELEKQLNDSFFKCHRSYIVNLQHVCGYNHGFAEMENNEHVPVSRLRKQEFLNSIVYYMKEKLIL